MVYKYTVSPLSYAVLGAKTLTLQEKHNQLNTGLGRRLVTLTSFLLVCPSMVTDRHDLCVVFLHFLDISCSPG